MRAVSPVHGYLCFFRLARTGREDDLINGSGNGGPRAAPGFALYLDSVP
jgi:hypothetical protein